MDPPGSRARRAILQLSHVSKHFPGVVALDDVSFDLYPGEVHVLVGENGAGKSTLVKLLAGIYQPDEGQILLDGAPVHSAIRMPPKSSGSARSIRSSI